MSFPYLHEADRTWEHVQDMGAYVRRGLGLVHRLANLVGNDIEIGDGARIDAFVTITGKVRIGRFVHVGAGAGIFGAAGFEIGDYSGLSPGVQIFTATEDVSGDCIMHPTCPEPEKRRVKSASIRIGKHCTVGANTVLLPGTDMPDGSVVGSLSLVKHSLSPWSIWAGVPAQHKRARSDRAIQLEAK